MPIFKEKPIREYKGHTSDVLDLNWSKVSFLFSLTSKELIELTSIVIGRMISSYLLRWTRLLGCGTSIGMSVSARSR